jgi:hypothetical protein
VLGVDEKQRQSIRASGADGQAHCTGCDPHALKLKDRAACTCTRTPCTTGWVGWSV